DALASRVAALVTTPGESRARLTAGIYTGGDGPVGAMAEALSLALWAEPLEKRMAAAVHAGTLEPEPGGDEASLAQAATKTGLLSREEAERLVRYYELVAGIVAVDDFDPTELAAAPLSPSENDRMNAWRKEGESSSSR
ncbi:MAG: acyl-CoA dehydrogenase domain-containing protein, partial [Gammaproteobacteria bacterium]